MSFRSKPLMQTEEGKVLPVDLSFIIEKCHTGVHWAMHDNLTGRKQRQDLFIAWGILFEEYVHWLLGGIKTTVPLTYVPRPQWENGNESFDGVVMQGAVMMPIECKGGFLSRKGRYATSPEVMLAEIDKNLAEGCDQLADKIISAFAHDATATRRMVAVPISHVRSVVPLLVYQDHALRSPLINWHLNKRFKARLAGHVFRLDLHVRALTVVTAHDLESMVWACEGGDFDFVHEIHHRVVRDEEGKTQLLDVLLGNPLFKKNSSPRRLAVLEEAFAAMTSYLFPGEIFEAEASTAPAEHSIRIDEHPRAS